MPDAAAQAGVTNALLQRVLEDRLAGIERKDAEYLEHFPGHGELVVAKLAQLNAMRSTSSAAGPTVMESAPAADVTPDVSADVVGEATTSDAVLLGRYRILHELGRGGQAVVHCAEDTQLRRRVALKVMQRASWVASATALRRFRAEAALASRLDDPRICAVYDVGDHEDVTFIAMRLVEGEPLWKWIARAREAKRNGEALPPWPGQAPGRSPQPQILAFFEQAARALHRAHEAGIVHRDIKPGNLMLTPEGTPVVLDFGLAHDDASADPGLTATGDVFGTPAFMSPEQHRGERTDGRTDVWSLGVSLYETLTLERPFAGASLMALARAVLESEPPDPRHVASGIDRDLCAVLGTAIEKSLARRYATAAEFADDLRRLREHEPVKARPAGAALRFWRWTQRNPMAATLLLVLSVGLASVLGLLWQVNALRFDEQLARDRLVGSTVASLEREADDSLWPELPEAEVKLAAWCERVEAVVALAPRLAAQLPGLDPAGTAAEDLRAAMAAIERIQAPDTGALARVRRRIEFVRTVHARTVVYAADAWRAATDAVDRDPRYEGLHLKPQIGLLPLGRDPGSGLHEFAHLRSGTVPVRDSATGQLGLGEESAIVLVLVPAGRWRIGAPEEEIGWVDGEGPRLDIDLPAYLIGKHEVSQGQWLRLTGANPSYHHVGSSFYGTTFDLRHPVESMSWREADVWMRRHGLRLPDEEEWEVAARAGTTSPWSCGSAELLERAANIADAPTKIVGFDDRSPWSDGFVGHAPVGRFAPNPFGLHDVHGNVAEWCANSWYSYETARAAGVQQGAARMVRGGAFDDGPVRVRSARRGRNHVNFRHNGIGLRVARTLES